MTQPYQEFGPYRLTHLLGKGGMASVYRALKSGPMGFAKEVAIKRIHDALADNDVILKSLINEARLGGQLRHPNIVEIYEFDKVGAAFYLAMEFVDGWTLDKVLKLAREFDDPIPPEVVLDILIQVCEGLHYAHTLESLDGQEVRLVHRDLKPANIIVSRHGVAKIMDFGIAKADTNLFKTTMADVTKGTPHYMSPEQVAGEPNLRPASDIFALGSVIYELVTGRVLFRGDNLSTVLFAVVKAEVETQCKGVDAEVPGLGDVMSRCLQRDPGDRYPDVQVLQRDLKALRLQMGEGLSLREYLYRLRTAVLASQQGAEEQGTVTEAVPDFATLLESKGPKDPVRKSASSERLAAMLSADNGPRTGVRHGTADSHLATAADLGPMRASAPEAEPVPDPRANQATTRDHPPVDPDYATDEVARRPAVPNAAPAKRAPTRAEDAPVANAPPRPAHAAAPAKGAPKATAKPGRPIKAASSVVGAGQILALATGAAALVVGVAFYVLRSEGSSADPAPAAVVEPSAPGTSGMDLAPVQATPAPPLAGPSTATPPSPAGPGPTSNRVTSRAPEAPPPSPSPLPPPVQEATPTSPGPAVPTPAPEGPRVTTIQGNPEVGGTGTLMVKKSTPWAWVWIDGRETGRQTPLQPLPLSTGKHRIELVSSDLQGRVAIDVDVKAGERVVIDKYDFGTRSWTK